MNEPTISVVIPAMNRAKVIGRAINSALAQTFPIAEIIIVDDGSTDDTVETVKKIATSDTKIILVKNNTNKGAPYSRNKGAALATGSLIAFLDSDDKWLPTKLEEQVKLLRNENACAVFTNFVFIRGEHRQLGAVKEKVTLADLFGRNILGGTSSVLVDKNTFNEVGGFTLELPSCQDWDLWLRLAEKTNLFCIDTPLVEYHIDGGQRISTNSDKAIVGHNYIFEKVAKLMVGKKVNKKRIKAQQKLRLAEIFVKNLGKKKECISNMIKSVCLYPNRKILLGNLKLFYFLIVK
jgi:glycosyltransferase involved in cell wall biosynthesis